MERKARQLGAIGGLLAALTVVAAAWRDAHGEDLTGYVEITGSAVDSTDSAPGAEPTETETRSLGERLHLSFNRRLWPRLTFWAGGTFDRADVGSTLDGVETDGTLTQVRPFVGLRRQGARDGTQLLLTRDQRRSEFEDLASLTTTRDGLFAAQTWSPRRGPATRVSYTRTHESDDVGGRDLASQLADLSLVQRLPGGVRTSYRGTWSNQDDDVVGTRGERLSHRADVQYEDAWLRDRVWFRSEYAVTRRDTTLESRGTGELVQPVPALAGLASRDDTPLDGILDPQPALVDGDTATSTGIDLGLPPLGGDLRPWGLGLDLGDRLAVDVLFVWIDRTIEDPEVAAALSWRVFVSDDGLTWTPVAALPAASFDDFRHRFELRLPPLTSRYLKVVVDPLGAAVPFADRYPDLFVTELEAGLRLVAPGVRVEDDRTVQTLSVDARARLLTERDLFYEGSYYRTDATGQDARWRASNGLSYVQPFADVWTVAARTALEQSEEPQVSERTLVYACSLSVTPVPRLHWLLSLSGREDLSSSEIGGDQTSVFLYGTAGLYEGLDVQLGIGRSTTTDLSDHTVTATQVSLTAAVVPRPDLAFGLSYLDSSSERVRGDLLGLFDLFTRSAEVNATWTPFPTTYLYGSYRLEWRTDAERDDVSSVVLSWSPFPLGALRMGVSYSESRRTALGRQERSFGPTLRWNVGPRSFLETSYRVISDESPVRVFEDEVLAATLRWGF